MNDLQKIPPRSIEEERLVLGTLMNERSAFDEVCEILTPECFYDQTNKEIFTAIEKIVHRGDRPDVLTVYSEMSKDKFEDISGLMKISENHTYDIYQHAAILFDKSQRRKFIEIGCYLTSNGFSESEDVVDVVSQVSMRLSDMFNSSDNNAVCVDEVIERVIKQININSEEGGQIAGTPIGFNEFDKRSGGLQKSDLIIIAGETSQGKTAFALSAISNAALRGAKVAVYSLEMKDTQLVSRIIAGVSGIPSTSIMYQKFDANMFKKLDATIGRIGNTKIYFDDRSTSNIDTIIASIRTMKKKRDIDGAMIDFLQILNTNMKGMNTEQQMGDVARRLKNLAKELDIWIIALSQLSRDHNSPEPSMNRLRASGQIAEAADVVALVYRPSEYGKKYPDPFFDKDTNGTAMIHVSKGRNSGTTKFICGFEQHTQKFYDLDYVPESVSTPKPSIDNLPF